MQGAVINMDNKCLLCGNSATITHGENDPLEQRFDYKCLTCGRYSVSDCFIKSMCLSDKEKNLLSKYIKLKNEEKIYDLLITEEHYQRIISDAMEQTGEYLLYDKK